MTATQDSVDPTLETLVPTRSTVRNVALAVVGVLALLAAWLSPEAMRPSIVTDSGGASWSALAPHSQVLTVEQVQADAWPRVDVRAVADVPGSHVVGAWLLTDGLAEYDDQLDPADFATPEAFLAAALPASVLSDANALPQTLDGGEATHLVVLWEITDCALLDSENPADVELRSVFRTTNRERLGPLSSPGFDVATLAESGICPLG